MKSILRVAVILTIVTLGIKPGHASTILSTWDFNLLSVPFSGPQIGSFTTGTANGDYNSTTGLLLSDSGPVFANQTLSVNAPAGPGGADAYVNGFNNTHGVRQTTNNEGWGAYTDSVSPSNTAQGSLILLFNNNNPASDTFNLSSSGYTGLTFQVNQRLSSNGGTVNWYYSTNGGATLVALTGTAVPANSTWATYTYSLPSLLDNTANFEVVAQANFVPGTTLSSFAVDNVELIASTTAVPEPSSFVLLGLGLVVIAFSYRKKMTAVRI